MIGGYDVYASIDDGAAQSFAVGGGFDGRIHLHTRVVAVFLGAPQQVMRLYFGGDAFGR